MRAGLQVGSQIVVRRLGMQVKVKRHTLGDKTLKARFGVGEVAEPLFDFLAAEGVA